MASLLASARFVVAGESMAPSFHPGDHLLVSRLAYRTRPPARGDVVIVRDPTPSARYSIKRIVGLPGEEVRVGEGVVLINGVAFDEPYPVLWGASSAPGVPWLPGPDEYFLLGDNRGHSGDSRRLGPVSRAHLVGPVWFRYWPPGRWGLIRPAPVSRRR